ncbi:AAA family ATPase [Shewanella oneidensis MR-1]|uniref:ParA family protein n=1 Tax=Shewanella oneidensis TaxID=70863 RepID=UPI0002E307F3|nr:AAA family ATPase [Shewanella oneidensis]MDX5997194.1 AAA family ATPase [Shewanella oneidensis]MEE2027198.1 hypothetical protein [Shewanella oneidensis]QKG95756.1 AAA family ATPase [Shewanella oneidensis MR-1]
MNTHALALAQASLTFSFISPDFWNQNLKNTRTIKNYFDAISQGFTPPSLSSLVIRPIVNNIIQQMGATGVVDLIPSHLGLINVDLELATLLGGANMNQAKLNYIKVHGKLRDSIVEFASTNFYDVVLIDCPPNFNIVTKNALISSDQILIPAKPDYLSTLGIDYLHRSVDQLIREFNEFASMDVTVNQSSPRMLGVVFTMIQIYSGAPIASQQQFITQTQRLGMPTFSTYFRENKSIFASAPQDGIPVTLHEYRGGTYSDVVSEINSFVDEFQLVAGV